MASSRHASLWCLKAHLPPEQAFAFGVHVITRSGGCHLAPCLLGGAARNLLSGSCGVSWLCPSEITLRPRRPTLSTL